MQQILSLQTIDHEGTRRIEAFLKELAEPLYEIPFQWKYLQLSQHIIGACQLQSKEKNRLTVSIFFCEGYFMASDIAKANDFPIHPTARWSQNGGILYIVESADPEKVSNVLGVFAGKE